MKVCKISMSILQILNILIILKLLGKMGNKRVYFKKIIMLVTVIMVMVSCNSKNESSKLIDGNSSVQNEFKIDSIPHNNTASFIRLSESNINVGKEGNEFYISMKTDGTQNSKFRISRIDIPDRINVHFVEVRDLTIKGFRLVIPENIGPHRDENITIYVDKVSSFISIHQTGYCRYCNSAGIRTCIHCSGQGKLVMPSGIIYCNYCNHTGSIKCEFCGGTGEN